MSTKHSNYWLDEELFDELDSDVTLDKEEESLVRITRLASARRAVANFVNILTNRNDIAVRFSSGKDSYTDGQSVVIAADDNPDHFDTMVGLALHEGSHILLTDFKFIQALADLDKGLAARGQTGRSVSWNTSNIQHYMQTTTSVSKPTVLENLFHPALAEMLPTAWYVADEEYRARDAGEQTHTTVGRVFLRDIRTIMNILEDRRIDKYVYRNAGGYRPYYDALYNQYFFTAEAGKNLKWNPEWREVTVQNYINRLLMAIHPAASVDALPGLKELYKLMDLPNIDRLAPTNKIDWKHSVAFYDQPEIWQVANTIYAYILRFAAHGNFDEQRVPVNPNKVIQATDNNSLPNLDPSSGFTPQDVEAPEQTKRGKEKPVSFNPARGKKTIENAMKVLNGEVKKKKATKREIEASEALESAQAKISDLEGHGIPGGQCMVTRKMSEGMFQQPWFIFGRRYVWNMNRKMEFFKKGLRMGQVLVHRLQVRNDPVMTKNTRLQNGGLDRRLLAQLGMDITSVFQKSRVDTFKPAMLHLTIDASGSMHGQKWEKVMVVATALAYVGSKMRNVDTVISIRGGNHMPMVCVVFDSRRDKFPTWMKWGPCLEPNGSTPEGLCFKATMELITECASTHEVYFINFSDGEPGFAYKIHGRKRDRNKPWWNDDNSVSYSGKLAVDHTRAMIQMIREKGIHVLSYFITDEYSYNRSPALDTFKRMYGEDAQNVNVENVTDVLRTLNKRLVARIA